MYDRQVGGKPLEKIADEFSESEPRNLKTVSSSYGLLEIEPEGVTGRLSAEAFLNIRRQIAPGASLRSWINAVENHSRVVPMGARGECCCGQPAGRNGAGILMGRWSQGRDPEEN